MIAPYMDLNKKRFLLNMFFVSQLNYCQLVCMCNNHTKNNKINRVHERCLRVIYNDNRNLRTLAIEMYKIYHGISPTFMNEAFTLRHQN